MSVLLDLLCQKKDIILGETNFFTLAASLINISSLVSKNIPTYHLYFCIIHFLMILI